MVDGLAVKADEIGFCFAAGLQDGFGVQFTKAPVEAAKISDGGWRVGHGTKDRFADLGWVGKGFVTKEDQAGAVGDAAQGYVDAVCGSSGHDAGYEERFGEGNMHRKRCPQCTRAASAARERRRQPLPG